MIILEIFTVIGLTVILGGAWVHNRLPEIALTHDISRIPRWIIDEWGPSMDPSEGSRYPKLFKGWRWVLIGLYFFLMTIFVFDSTGRWPFRLLLAIASIAFLGRLIYYIENQPAK